MHPHKLAAASPSLVVQHTSPAIHPHFPCGSSHLPVCWLGCELPGTCNCQLPHRLWRSWQEVVRRSSLNNSRSFLNNSNGDCKNCYYEVIKSHNVALSHRNSGPNCYHNLRTTSKNHDLESMEQIVLYCSFYLSSYNDLINPVLQSFLGHSNQFYIKCLLCDQILHCCGKIFN